MSKRLWMATKDPAGWAHLSTHKAKKRFAKANSGRVMRSLFGSRHAYRKSMRNKRCGMVSY